jgi:hypothetical protein
MGCVMLLSHPGDSGARIQASANQVEQRAEGGLELDHERVRVGRLEAFDLLHRGGQPAGFHLVADAPEVLQHVVGRHGTAVVEFDPVTQVEHVGQHVVGHRPALRQQALRAAVERDRGQGFRKRMRQRDRAGMAMKVGGVELAPLEVQRAAILLGKDRQARLAKQAGSDEG